ncbi:hypothetical protein CPB86DRAFT_829961 [Serendipita vermifera]|nr:hypothetical protein CPB86DRAFT_829961 [Serendipita vermifera]
MRAMEECGWLHLACHGTQNPGEPTKSALILEDGHLTLEEIIRLNLPNAEFAFLSACQTTKGDEKLSEEAVHIAGGMLLAGYRGVVATMWSIKDDLAPEVADEFYAHLTRDGQRPDNRKAAEALHVSIQKLRQKKDVPLTAWIPFYPRWKASLKRWSGKVPAQVECTMTRSPSVLLPWGEGPGSGGKARLGGRERIEGGGSPMRSPSPN